MNAHIINIKTNTHTIIDCSDYNAFTKYCEENKDIAYSLQMLDMSMNLMPEIPQAFAVTEDIVVFTESAYENEFIKQHELGHIHHGHVAAALSQAGTDAVVINDDWEIIADAYAVEHSSRELALATLGSIKEQVKNNKHLPDIMKEATIRQLDLRIQAL